MIATLFALVGAALIASTSAAVVSPTFIFNGTEVPRNTYPFMTSITKFGSHFCGGVLISPKVVITAGHCLEDSPRVGSLRARLGGVELDRPGTFSTYRVARYELHPFYRDSSFLFSVNPSGPQRASTNDIAVVYLEEAADETPAKINVDFRLESDGAPVNAVGWGVVRAAAFRPSNELLEVELTATSQATCFSEWADFDVAVGTGTVCATDLTGNRDACFGDSGGPLLGFKANGDARLVGLVSAGDSRCRDRAPGIYLRVSDYHCWLESLGIPGVRSPTGPCDARSVVPPGEVGPGNVVGGDVVTECAATAVRVAQRITGDLSCGSTNIRRVVVQTLKSRCRSGVCRELSSGGCSRKLAELARRIVANRC